MRLTQGILWVSWNIFLALIPVALGYAIWGFANRYKSHGRLFITIPIILLGLAWLVFLPNSCYLLTEWRHFLEVLGYTNIHLQWEVDSSAALLLMVLSLFYIFYSGVGVLAFALAIRPVAELFRQTKQSLFWIGIPFFLLMSLGVYLGLIHRFNTWDLLHKPGNILLSVNELASRPMRSTFIIIFAGLLWLIYLAADVWIDGLVYRWKHRRDK